MAIMKSIKDTTGATATYWNIGAVQQDFRNGGAEITIYGYIDEAARRDQAQPLIARKFSLTTEQANGELARSGAYAWVKQQEGFEDATDC